MQSHPEGSCLRYPDQIAPQREVSYEAALNMLLRAMSMAQNVPFSWGYVDRPSDGAVLLLFLPPGNPYPNDGIRWQDNEAKMVIPAGPRELEVCEIKFGFVPGAGEANASRLRRRYRLLKGGYPQLVLIHYTRGPPTLIQPQLMNQPIRVYPLRPINEPSVYVAGEKQGQKVFPPNMQGGGGGAASAAASGIPGPGGGGAAPMGVGVGVMGGIGVGMGGVGGPGGAGHGGAGGAGAGVAGGPPTTPIGGINLSIHQQQALLQQQNSQMEALERRRERERAATVAQQSQVRAHHRVPEEEESADEIDQISTRTLALARYKRNHDWMNQVFYHAAFSKPNHPQDPTTMTTPYLIFNKAEMQGKVAKLQAEIDALQTSSAQIRAEKVKASQSQEDPLIVSGAEAIIV